MDTSLKYSKCSKHGKILIVQGSRFRADKRQPVTDNGSSYWRCTETGCSAKLKVIDEKVVKTYGQHVHSERSKESRNNGQPVHERKQTDVQQAKVTAAATIEALAFDGDSLPNPDELDLAELVRQKELLEAKLREAELTNRAVPEVKVSKSIRVTAGASTKEFKEPKEANGEKRKTKRHNEDIDLKTVQPAKKSHIDSIVEKISINLEITNKKASRETSDSPERIVDKSERFDRYASERENNGRDNEPEGMSRDSNRRKRESHKKSSRRDESRDRHKLTEVKKHRKSSERDHRNQAHGNDRNDLIERNDRKNDRERDRERVREPDRDRAARPHKNDRHRSRSRSNSRHRRERSVERLSGRREDTSRRKDRSYSDHRNGMNGNHEKDRDLDRNNDRGKDKGREKHDERDRSGHRNKDQSTNGKRADTSKDEENGDDRIDDMEEEDEEAIIERRRKERQELLKRLGAVQNDVQKPGRCQVDNSFDLFGFLEIN
jgi:serine/threonine-protein kinase PRP4